MVSGENLRITKFYLACREGNIELVRELVNEGLDVDVTNENGDTGLIWASLKGQDNIVLFLIQHGADLNKQDKLGNTALMYACSRGHKNVVRSLIENRADANIKNNRSETALIKACFGNQRHIVYFLLKNVRHLNQDGVKLLLWASGNGYVKIVKQLLRMGANVNEVYSDNDMPLFMTRYGKIPRTVRLSLENTNNFIGLNRWVPAIGDTPLLMACIGGYTDIVRILLSNGANVDMKNENNNSPLLIACIGGYKKIVELILKKNPNIETRNINGWVPLVFASYSGRYSLMELLLRYGADPNTIDNTGNTALMFACDKSNEAIVKLLIRYGADVNMADEEGDTALIRACMENSETIVRLLLMNGAHVNGTNEIGQSALMWASDVGNISIIESLLNRGARIDFEDLRGDTAFMWACSANNFDAAKFLLNRHADINNLAKRITNGKTFLMRLCEICKSSDFFNWLITQYCNKNGMDALRDLINEVDDREITTLMYACNEDSLEIVRILLANGADVNARNINNNTVLHVACRQGSNTKLIDLLLEQGIDIDAENSNGNTPLHMACGNNLLDKTNFLIKRGANFRKLDAQGDSALHIACIYQSIDVIHTLIEIGLDVDAKNNMGRTPLIIACNRENEDIVKILIEFDADVNCVDVNGNTPLKIACLKNDVSMGHLLILNFADLYSLSKVEENQRELYINLLNETSDLKIKIRTALYKKDLRRLQEYLNECFVDFNIDREQDETSEHYIYRSTCVNLDKIDDLKDFIYALYYSREIKRLREDNNEIRDINDKLKENPIMNAKNRTHELDLNKKLIHVVALFKDVICETSTENIVKSVFYIKMKRDLAQQKKAYKSSSVAFEETFDNPNNKSNDIIPEEGVFESPNSEKSKVIIPREHYEDNVFLENCMNTGIPNSRGVKWEPRYM